MPCFFQRGKVAPERLLDFFVVAFGEGLAEYCREDVVAGTTVLFLERVEQFEARLQVIDRRLAFLLISVELLELLGFVDVVIEVGLQGLAKIFV